MPNIRIVLLPILFMLAVAVAAQEVDEDARFELFNDCLPMFLIVEPLSDYAADIGLTQEALKAASESRLRAARLYTENHKRADFSLLHIGVLVTGPAMSINVRYRKNVTDKFGVFGLPITWDSSSTGTHGGDATRIVSILSEHLDKFLAAYLRINEAACEDK